MGWGEVGHVGVKKAAHEKRLLCAQKCTWGRVGWGMVGWVM